ncbi:MAG: hypothetical protein WC456_02645 [Patescibacteria group bacterium]
MIGEKSFEMNKTSKEQLAMTAKGLAARIAAEFDRSGDSVNFDQNGIGSEIDSLVTEMKNKGFENFENLDISADEAKNLNSAYTAWLSL